MKMTDISHNTWKYLHGPDDTVHLSFSTDGVPRSFSVVQYEAFEYDEIDFDRNGIAIIDNDTMSIVLDDHLKNDSIKQIQFMSRVRKMNLNWKAFSEFCTEHPRYRDQAPDMKQSRPDPGVIVNQIQRDVMHAPMNEKDLRSPSMVAAHANPDCVYDFPETPRSRMILNLLSHDAIKDEDELWRIAWKIGFDNILSRPESGQTGQSDQNQDSDNDWQRYYRDNPEIRYRISDDILDPYFSGRIGTWPKTDTGRYAFLSGGVENMDYICLASIDGVDLGFESRGKIGAFLDKLEDPAIRDLWKLITVVDYDLSQPIIDAACEAGLEHARADFERDQGKSMEPGP